MGQSDQKKEGELHKESMSADGMAEMRRLQEVALRARPYIRYASGLFWFLTEQGSHAGKPETYLEERTGKRICLVVMASDKRFAGDFDENLLQKSWSLTKALQESGYEVDIAAVGHSAYEFFTEKGVEPVVEFQKFSHAETFKEIEPLAEWILSAYEAWRYDQIHFCSTQFVSDFVYAGETSQVLPLRQKSVERIIQNIIPQGGVYADYAQIHDTPLSYEGSNFSVQPSPQAVLSELAKKIIRAQILHLVLESNVSELYARMNGAQEGHKNI